MPVFVIAASLAAGVIHVALGPEHLDELGVLGWGFYLAGALQVGWAVLAVATSRLDAPWAVARCRTSLLRSTGIAINLAILLAWVAARAIGLPTADGGWERESIGVSDSITALLELAVVLPLVHAWRSRRGSLAAAALPAARTTPAGVPSLLAAAPVLGLIVIATVMAIGTPHAHADDAHGAPGGAIEASGNAHTH